MTIHGSSFFAVQKQKALSHHNRQGREIFFHFPIWEGQLFNFPKSISMLITDYSHSRQSQGIFWSRKQRDAWKWQGSV